MAPQKDIRWLSVLGFSVWEACVLQALLPGEAMTHADIRTDVAFADGLQLATDEIDDLTASIRRKLEGYGATLEIQRDFFRLSASDRENLEDLRKSMVMPERVGQ